MTGRPADAVLAAALRCAQSGQPAMLVTIAATKGSTPRVPGTRMLVTLEGIVGSVGGGQLEFDIIAHARNLMAQSTHASLHEHFILGPDLRQCCGGALDVVLEPIASPSSIWLRQVTAWDQDGRFWESSLRLGEASDARRVHLLESAPAEPGTARLCKTDDGTILVEHSGAPWPLIYLFGAGHVGRALINLLGDLPYHVIWSDGRADIFPPQVPGNVMLDAGEMNADMIKAAPEGAHFLVMTHSHALDFEIVEAILQQGNFASLGLIGSDTKRVRFLQRLREVGIPESQLIRLQCPVGLTGIKSKAPAAIAIAVVAEFLLRSEAAVPRLEKAAAGVQLPG